LDDVSVLGRQLKLTSALGKWGEAFGAAVDQRLDVNRIRNGSVRTGLAIPQSGVDFEALGRCVSGLDHFGRFLPLYCTAVASALRNACSSASIHASNVQIATPESTPKHAL
jgi:hypothetical protein